MDKNRGWVLWRKVGDCLWGRLGNFTDLGFKSSWDAVRRHECTDAQTQSRVKQASSGCAGICVGISLRLRASAFIFKSCARRYFGVLRVSGWRWRARDFVVHSAWS